MPRADDTTAATADYWDSVIGSWIEHGRDQLWRAHSDAVNAALLSRWLPRTTIRHALKTDLFDEAVAAGVYPVLQQHARRVTGIDLSPRTVQAARARYPRLEGVATDVLHLPFSDGEFDAVVSLSTLDHFDDLGEMRAAFLELSRVLARQGTLVITIDNSSNPVVAVRNRMPYSLLRRVGLVPYRVGATCGARDLVALLGSCDFDVHDVTFLLHCPRALAVLAARALARTSSGKLRTRLLRVLEKCEGLGRLSSRAFTGYFVAALAAKR